MQFWSTDRRGAVEIATFSNPPHNYLNKPVIDELEQLVVQWRDPSIRAVVIQSRAEDTGTGTLRCAPASFPERAGRSG